MFQDDKDLAPISMIITTLAARSYSGEADVYEALINVLNRMRNFVKNTWPKVMNPVNPAEDFADAWGTNPALESNFWSWHAQALRDVTSMAGHRVDRADQLVQNSLGLTLTAEQKQSLSALTVNSAPAVVTTPKTTRIESAPEPWLSE